MRLPSCASGVILALALAQPQPAAAHEFWIAPEESEISAGEPLVADLKNGQNFKGNTIGFFPGRFARFEVIMGGLAQPVPGRMGDFPALSLTPGSEGLAVILHETRPETLTYKTWEKFAAFADEKGFGDMRARHLGRGLPETGFTERYTRHVKALVAVGHGRGQDTLTGMATEFVAGANPYTDDIGAGLPVRLFRGGAPWGDAMVTVFDRAPDGVVSRSLLRSDPDGRLRVPSQPGHAYLLDAVLLRPAPADSGAAWETLWAGLHYTVPDAR